MQSTNQLLTDRERNYAKRRFRNAKFAVRGLWPVFIIVALSGVPLLLVDDESFWPGVALVAFGILGAVFFKRYSKKTSFEMSPTKHVHRGVLNLRLVGAPTERHHRLYLDDYLMETPDGLEFYMNDLVEKYKGQKVEVMLGVFEQKKDGKTYEHYTPLKIEKDLCVDSAIKNHGPSFLRKETYRLYFEITIFIILFSIVTMTTFFILDFLDVVNILFFILLFFPLFLLVFMTYDKLVPRNNLDIQERTKCTCA